MFGEFQVIQRINGEGLKTGLHRVVHVSVVIRMEVMNFTVIQIGSRTESIHLIALIPGASKIYLTLPHACPGQSLNSEKT